MASSVETLTSGSSQRAQTSAGMQKISPQVTGKLLPAPAGSAVKPGTTGLINGGKPAIELPELNEAIARIQDYVQDNRRSLEFRLDDSTGITVVSVYDLTTQELIRQIPSEEAVTLAQKLNQEEPLSLFRAQV